MGYYHLNIPKPGELWEYTGILPVVYFNGNVPFTDTNARYFKKGDLILVVSFKKHKPAYILPSPTYRLMSLLGEKMICIPNVMLSTLDENFTKKR